MVGAGGSGLQSPPGRYQPAWRGRRRLGRAWPRVGPRLRPDWLPPRLALPLTMSALVIGTPAIAGMAQRPFSGLKGCHFRRALLCLDKSDRRAWLAIDRSAPGRRAAALPLRPPGHVLRLAEKETMRSSARAGTNVTGCTRQPASLLGASTTGHRAQEQCCFCLTSLRERLVHRV